MAAQVSNSDLPCDGDGVCMVCKVKPSSMADETLTCKTCATPWHVPCLSLPPQSMADALQWNCPDCSSLCSLPSSAATAGQSTSDLIAAIRAIEADTSLTERQKAERRQQLMCKQDGDGDGDAKPVPSDGSGGSDANAGNDLLDLLGGNLNCSICMQLPERPITTPCGHNFCLKCFQKWVGQGKRTCANCRNSIPPRVASNPRINSALVMAIRMAKVSKSNAQVGQPKVYHFVHNQNRPDKCFTTERAKKSGKANACSGKIFVTAPPDHFGPILAENDPTRNQGVLVGESWEDRMECRQWGTHLPHVAGIAGQSGHGAQSVALSGGYEDDEDHGEWFLYTGSGGRDLSGNKRTNVTHSFDQKFEKLNEALRVSCRKGYPVRVVRSHKEKRSAYAPETGVHYDGVYRIEKCWRKNGNQGYKVCRYLFVRCDNEPAPWTSNDHGDLPRPLPAIPELNTVIDLTERKESPAWDYDEEKGRWLWKKPPPPSKKRVNTDGLVNVGEERRKFKRRAQSNTVRERLLKEFSCNICRKVMTLPITTPCAHNFCKGCLEGAFAGQTLVRQRNCEGRRTLRAQKNVMKCPYSSCTNDIAEFLQNPQINRELMGVIESLKQKDTELEENGESSSNDGDDVQEEHGISDDDDETENAAQEEAKENNSVESDTNVTSKQEKANSCSPKLVVKASIERQIGTNDGKTENSVKPQSDDKASLEQHDGVNDENTENIVKPRENPKESKAKQPRKRKKSENGANDEKTQNSVKPQSDVEASLVQHDVANDENTENIVNPQENKKESKVKQTHKQKKSENGGNLPLVNVGATTRSKRAKLAAA